MCEAMRGSRRGSCGSEKVRPGMKCTRLACYALWEPLKALLRAVGGSQIFRHNYQERGQAGDDDDG